MAESLPAGSEEDWLCWRALNRLRTGVGRAKTVMRRWGYLDDTQSVDCDCGEPQTMAHLLSCRLLDEACMADDLATVTERAKACARTWEKIVIILCLLKSITNELYTFAAVCSHNEPCYNTVDHGSPNVGCQGIYLLLHLWIF